MRIVKYTYLIKIILFFLCSDILAQDNEIEKKFIAAGLVDVGTADKTILVDLVNSDPQKNFFREDYYRGLNRAYLQKETAIKLSKAQTILKSKKKGFSLQVLDAARPRSVSKLMYDKMKGTKFEKYVANPDKGSMHNYGIAVDITIIDQTGNEIDMGFSPFRKSTTEIYWQYLKMKFGFKLTKEQSENRQLLADIMKQADFIPLSHEWWHFDGMQKEQARKRYKIIE